MSTGLAYISLLLGLLSGTQAQLPTSAKGSIGKPCTDISKMMESTPGKFSQMLYGPALWGYEEMAGGAVKVDFGGEAIVLDSFTYTPKPREITFRYAEIPPAVSQGVDTVGTTISIKMKGKGKKCKLDTSYTLPAAAANSYPAKVYYAGVIHSIIDFTQLEMGGVDCPLYTSPTMHCHATSGASFTPLRRETTSDPDYVGNGPKVLDVSPRTISNAVIDQGDDTSPTPNSLSSLFTFFGQFVDHDLDLTPGGGGKWAEAMNITVDPADPLYDEVGLRFGRSQYMRKDNATPLPRNHINVLTAFIDGGQIYGNTWEKFFALRSFVGGKLRTGAGGNLPPQNGFEMDGVKIAMDPGADLPGIYATGDVRGNENEVLLSIHALWVKEHNKICDELKPVLGNASDEEYFQHARRVVIAELQAIIFREWLPLLLGEVNAPNFLPKQSNKDPQISAAFSTAAFRFGHSLLPEEIPRVGANGESIEQGAQPLPKSLFNFREIGALGIEVYLKGSIYQLARNLDNKVINQLRNILFKETGFPGLTGVDLPSLNIQRGRDHGIVSLQKMQQIMGTGNSSLRPGCAKGFKAAYGPGWKAQVELWPGGLCESPASFSLLGKTFGAIIKDQFERVRDADPYWFTSLTTKFPKLKRYPRASKIQLGSVKIADIITRNTAISQFDLPSLNSAFQAKPSFTMPFTFPEIDNQGRFNQLLDAIVTSDPTEANLNSDVQVRDEAQQILEDVSGVDNSALETGVINNQFRGK